MNTQSPPPSPGDRLAMLQERARIGLPGHLGIEIVEAAVGRLVAQMVLSADHLAPNGYLHAGTVVALADTACGFGCVASLPPGAIGFTTIELKSNFMATVTTGLLRCQAQLRHGGRTTQVWDAEIGGAADKTVALFRCTQLILYPRGTTGTGR